MVNLKVLVAGAKAGSESGAADARPGVITVSIDAADFEAAVAMIKVNGVFSHDLDKIKSGEVEAKFVTWYSPGSIICAKPA